MPILIIDKKYHISPPNKDPHTLFFKPSIESKIFITQQFLIAKPQPKNKISNQTLPSTLKTSLFCQKYKKIQHKSSNLKFLKDIKWLIILEKT